MAKKTLRFAFVKEFEGNQSTESHAFINVGKQNEATFVYVTKIIGSPQVDYVYDNTIHSLMISDKGNRYIVQKQL